jgi:Rad3-related DNA helicase
MSGTILNKQSYCRNLGIPQDECEFISLNSPFPIQNRKIFFLNSGSMSKKNIDQNINNVIITINKIL